MADVRADVKELAGRIAQRLAQKPAQTAWELKMALKLTHTRLHLALGWLLAEGKITLRADKLTFVVEAVPAAQAETSESAASAAV